MALKRINRELQDLGECWTILEAAHVGHCGHSEHTQEQPHRFA
jgi:hypothetical protein